MCCGDYCQQHKIELKMFAKPFIYILGLSLVPFLLFSQETEPELEGLAVHEFRHHVVVLIDRSGSMKRKMERRKGMQRFKSLLSTQVNNILFEPGQVLPEEMLLREKDYLSIAFFGLGRNNQYDYKRYISQEINGRHGELGKTYWENHSPEDLQAIWGKIQRYNNSIFSGNFTGLSFAGPMGVNYFKQKQKKVHRTFVIIISDGQFNSIDDPSSELVTKAITDRRTGERHRLNNQSYVDQVFSSVKSNYLWHPELFRQEYGPFKLNIYEYKPNQSNLSSRSILEMPANLQVLRTPNGFEKTFSIKDSDPTDDYVPRKVLVRITHTDSDKLIYEKTNFFENGQAKITIHDLPSAFLNDSLKMSLFFWIDFGDDAYGAHQLHPFGSDEQGAGGLKESLTLTFEPTGKIWGVIPLSNSMFSLSSSFMGAEQNQNIRFWNHAFGVLLLAMLLIFGWRYLLRHRETKDPDSISIQTISGIKIK